ncbi:hypothetical protein MU516_14495 [Paracoccus sp. YLB-12]|jgi:hypothetical protein|uniref:Uncharacterized protein n=1 Tax=Paracoccus maritimus TaxID=2933292 RepID=A0ABT2KC28_9RHOB|nr:hypothetical protein [Paracoccus sp. YLB-12]MCT4334072.1 hypothetical protein [Paracoccus sp. YLB-12]
MNFLSQISLISLPVWVKTALAALLIFCLFSGIYIFIDAITGKTSDSALSASAYLLGIITPVSILGVVFATSYAGERNLTERTEHFLTKTIPFALATVSEGEARYRDPEQFPASPHPNPQNRAKVLLNHRRGACKADYLVHLPRDRGALSLCVELNVRRANVLIGFPGAAPNITTADVARKLSHSLGIREDEDPFQILAAGSVAGARGLYHFNPTLMRRSLNSRPHNALSCSMSLPQDFLWNAAERLYFAQDLAIMLRAFVYEWPEGVLMITSEAANGE